MVSADLQDTGPTTWFHIRSVATGKVITCISGPETPLRSQVYVCPYQSTDSSLWTWDDSFIRNKATNLVLDIRKGRIRMMEDTEICLYSRKASDDAHNQKWGCRESMDDLGRKQQGSFIYSLGSPEWVLDIGPIDGKHNNNNKLILFPSQTIDNDNQRWVLEPAIDTTSISCTASSFPMDASISPTSHATASAISTPTATAPVTHMDQQSYHEFSFSSRSSSSVDLAGMDFPYGLMPAKRGSQSSGLASSLSAYKESHQLVYIQQAPQSSDKVMAMAAAYETWQVWKKDHLDQALNPSATPKEQQDKVRSTLSSLARAEATRLLNDTNTPATNTATHRQSVLNLTNRYILQLYDQLPSTP